MYSSVGNGVADSAAKGDMPSQNAPVSWRQLPASVGQYVNSDVVGRSHGNGDMRRGSDAADENVKPCRKKSASDIASQSSGDARAVGSKSGERGDNILSNVSQASHLLTAFYFMSHSHCIVPLYFLKLVA